MEKAVTTDKPHVKMFGTRNSKLQYLFLKQSVLAYGVKVFNKESASETLKYILPAIFGIAPKDELEGMTSLCKILLYPESFQIPSINNRSTKILVLVKNS
jgi:hypothetical protein